MAKCRWCWKEAGGPCDKAATTILLTIDRRSIQLCEAHYQFVVKEMRRLAYGEPTDTEEMVGTEDAATHWLSLNKIPA